MKVNIIVEKNQVITADMLVDELINLNKVNVYTADNLLMVVKHHNDSEEISNFLAREDLNFEMIENNLSKLKKHTSFIAVTKENHLIASGDFNNCNPIYYLERNDELFVSFHPELISNFTKQKLNKTYFALRIVNFETIYPFSELTPWENIKLLNSRKMLVVLEGQISQVFPFRSNGGNKRISEVAVELRQNVKDVLQKNLGKQIRISADLSGGLDSTSLCYFCKDLGVELNTIFLSPEDGADSDAIWSERASKEVSAEHTVLPYSSTITLNSLNPLDIYKALPFGPSESFRYISLARKIIEIGLKNDIGMHINGHGGDELFGPLSTMAWSLYHSNYPNRIKNLYGFARLNKFNLFKFFKSLVDNESLSDNLRCLECREIEQIDFDIKYSSQWVPKPSVANFVTQTARDLITSCASSYAEQNIEPYSDDKSIHRILEEVEAHSLLQRDLNAMVPNDKSFRFLSPYTAYDIVESALQYNIDERFNAKVTKPMLAEIRSESMSLEYFKRRDKGEYTKSTFTEYNNRKNMLQKIFSEECLIYKLGLVDKRKLLQSLNKFSADGEQLENIMRIQIIEYWLRGYCESGGIYEI
ncbi:asparagine synthase C-terminal domain-containing protein [Streptococcus oralis]|uniref:asparagine synthase C-terminal domain-containing protein n=1 Tax=Streptococcus oralis TaxID=1303 RepID=UPI001BB031E2|nr:asparagine synthase C-terminal domain-containing protein [Streptococcus oralis]MBS3688197.1 asparagine synthase [Streptococcus oralis]